MRSVIYNNIIKGTTTLAPNPAHTDPLSVDYCNILTFIQIRAYIFVCRHVVVFVINIVVLTKSGLIFTVNYIIGSIYPINYYNRLALHFMI